MIDQVMSYREMCDRERLQVLQRGMNFRSGGSYSVILMSQRPNAPYADRIMPDGLTILYEGHDDRTGSGGPDPKTLDQPRVWASGKLTQNGMFAAAADAARAGDRPEIVRVYEKIMTGVWSYKGEFDLVDVAYTSDGVRKRFLFTLTLREQQGETEGSQAALRPRSRIIPSEVKKEVWRRDRGRCVLCGATDELHFDHDLPFSKGGTSVSVENVRLLCARHNLEKSDKIQ